MKTVTSTYARNNFQDIVNKAVYQNETIIVTRRNKPLVVIQPFSQVQTDQDPTLPQPTLKLNKKISPKQAKHMFRDMKENYAKDISR